MITLLRWIRGICGVIFCYSLFLLLGGKLLYVTVFTSFLPSSFKPNSLSEINILFYVAILVSPIATGILFFVLRNVINGIHKKEYGTEHPRLGKSVWKF